MPGSRALRLRSSPARPPHGGASPTPESWTEFFSSEFFMPHGHCYLWKPALVWLQVISNGAIAAAYISIFATLVYLVTRIRDLPFQWMYVAFAVFIVTCGVTHLFDVYVIWNPAYWLDGTVRAVTAIASVATAIMLPPLVPKAIALAEAARVSHERGLKLEAVNRELGLLLDRTKELDELKTQFFANVSHELRTPLALILGPVERLLERPELPDDERQDLQVVSRNAQTLLKHVNDLLEVSRLEAGKAPPHYVDADVGQLIRVVASHFDGVARERGMTYVVDAPEQLPGQVDADKVERVVLNLLSNAFKFTPRGGRIRCAARREERGARAWLRVEVADSGPGIRPEQRELVFERFRQVEAGPTRQLGGTGLGLAIARDFVTLHGGQLSVGEAPEGGALFTVELPMTAPEGQEVVAGDAGPVAGLATEEAARQAVEELRAPVEAAPVDEKPDRPRVLIVEDNVDMNRFLQKALSADYQVDTAFDGQEGLRKASERRPDLIMTDIMMPALSGDQLVHELRRRAEFDAVPVVVLTAKADDELRLRLLREGAQDYVMKPFSIEEVRARVGTLVAMKRARDVLQGEVERQMKDLGALAHEVTARKRALEDALGSLRVARDAAERASRMKSNFLGMVSHEFRTPVTALQLQLELLRRELGQSPTDRQGKLLERMAAASARLAVMIESLLQHARVESGRLTTEVTTFDLPALVAESIEGLRSHAEQKALDLRAVIAPDLPPLRSDPQLVRLILSNLLTNAIKFTERGEVEVSVTREGDAHVLAVRDTGPGIPVEEQARLFKPFEQLEPVKAKHLPGIGLGLALVEEMATTLGGRVELRSAVGVGSTFTVYLPAAAGGPS